MFYVIRQRADCSGVEHGESQQRTGVLDGDAPGEQRETFFPLTAVRQETIEAIVLFFCTCLMHSGETLAISVLRNLLLKGALTHKAATSVRPVTEVDPSTVLESGRLVGAIV